VLPLHWRRVINDGLTAVVHRLHRPRFLPLAVETSERNDVTSNLAHQIG
jgi:hypothetical protein